MKQSEDQIRSVTNKPICFLWFQGLARDWSKHNGAFREIFSVFMVSKFECRTKKTDLKLLLLQLSSQDLFKL